MGLAVALGLALAGGLGSALRYLVDQSVTRLVNRRDTPAAALPWGTFSINVTGSFVLGVLSAAAAQGLVSEDLRLVLGVGLCGGYTTFSTAMVDTLRLQLQARPLGAVLYFNGTLVCATGAAALGWVLGNTAA